MGAERAPAAPAKAGHRFLGVARADQLPRDRDAERLSRFRLPDDEAAAGVLARPARIPLAVLGDLASADRARAELRPRDAHIFERLVELVHGLVGKAGDVAHELLARVFAALDLAQPVLPAAGQFRRGQRVRVEQADHVEPLLGRDERAPVTLEVADRDQALDDRRARRRRADPRLLHRLAQLVVVDELARGLHRPQQRRVGVAPRRLGLLLGGRDLARVDVLALLELGEGLVATLVVGVGVRLRALLGGLLAV